MVYRLAELAGQELKALQANDFSSTVDISAHASGVRILVLRVLKAAVSLIKAKGKSQDPTMEQSEEQDTAVTAQMGKRLEPLWTALSAAISQIEAKLPANTAPSSELPSAASSILPPGAAQVLHGPIAVLHGPTEMLHGPIEVLHGPIEVLHGPIEMLHGPTEMLHGPIEVLLVMLRFGL